MRKRIQFLDWRPDLDAENNPGLITANNVIHEPEGYKATAIQSSGAFSTTGGLAASLATVHAVQVRPIGSQNENLAAWIANDTLHIGIGGVTATTSSTGFPPSLGTTGSVREIVSFDAAELEGNIFFAAEAQLTTINPDTTVTLRSYGFIAL